MPRENTGAEAGAGNGLPVAAAGGRVTSVSVDLDSLACYYRIHAIEDAGDAHAARHVVLRRCLPRFADLFAKHGVKATFFVVGEDLELDPEGASRLAELARDGHELANHSHRHRYDFVRLGATAIADEIDRAHAAIAERAGMPPVGFRAPGYEINAEVLGLLRSRAYRYDSSVFPAAPYYLAKAAVMAGMRVVGRRSGSILGSPRVLFAPSAPYPPRIDDPYRMAERPTGDLVELPVAVTRLGRLPVIGTSLILAPAWLRRRLVNAALAEPFFNLELHGIDLADAREDDIPAPLVARQPDLRRSCAHKLSALDEALGAARAAGATFMTLRDFASRLAPIA